MVVKVYPLKYETTDLCASPLSDAWRETLEAGLRPQRMP
jgi:hypothetical protein